MSSQSTASCPQCNLVYQPSALTSFCMQCNIPLMLVAGKYQLHQKLSEGGCGVLYLARHINLNMMPWRVIKFLKPEYFSHPTASKRFAYEVEITSALSQKSPHIVRVYDDFGEIPRLGSYYVMEYLEGEDLYSWQQRVGDLPQDFILYVMNQVLSALAEAHQVGIIHRDLKPHNIFLVKNEDGEKTVKLIDFGIAKRIAAQTMLGLTQGGIIGTPEYMAPEQCKGQNIDHRADIYALGVVLYQLLTGRTPFLPPDASGISAMQMAIAQMTKRAQTLKEARPDKWFSQELEDVIAKALEKEPIDRFQTAVEFQEALQALQTQKPDPTLWNSGAFQVHSEPIHAERSNTGSDYVPHTPPGRSNPLPTVDGFTPTEFEVPSEYRSHKISSTPSVSPALPVTAMTQLNTGQKPKSKKWIGYLIALTLVIEVIGAVWFIAVRKKTSPTPNARTSKQIIAKVQAKPVRVRTSVGSPSSRMPPKGKMPIHVSTKQPDSRSNKKRKPPRQRIKKRTSKRRSFRRKRRYKTPKRSQKKATSFCPSNPDKGNWLDVRFTPRQLRIQGAKTGKRTARRMCLYIPKSKSVRLFVSAPGYYECHIKMTSKARTLHIRLKRELQGFMQLQQRPPFQYCIQ